MSRALIRQTARATGAIQALAKPDLDIDALHCRLVCVYMKGFAGGCSKSLWTAGTEDQTGSKDLSHVVRGERASPSNTPAHVHSNENFILLSARSPLHAGTMFKKKNPKKLQLKRQVYEAVDRATSPNLSAANFGLNADVASAVNGAYDPAYASFKSLRRMRLKLAGKNPRVQTLTLQVIGARFHACATCGQAPGALRTFCLAWLVCIDSDVICVRFDGPSCIADAPSPQIL